MAVAAADFQKLPGRCWRRVTRKLVVKALRSTFCAQLYKVRQPLAIKRLAVEFWPDAATILVRDQVISLAYLLNVHRAKVNRRPAVAAEFG